mgnify:CR=1 FL=1
MAEPTFTGPFRKEMENFISLKRSVGYKYNTEPGILKRFDSYLAAKYPDVAAFQGGRDRLVRQDNARIGRKPLFTGFGGTPVFKIPGQHRDQRVDTPKELLSRRPAVCAAYLYP